MTTEPQKTETLEEIAERIVANLDWMNFKSLAPKELKDTILSALRDERERCAIVALEQRCAVDKRNARILHDMERERPVVHKRTDDGGPLCAIDNRWMSCVITTTANWPTVTCRRCLSQNTEAKQ